MTTAVIHITGVPAQVGPLLRQRCAWCGTLLLDYDLTRVAVPEGQDPQPGAEKVGGQVKVKGRPDLAQFCAHLGHAPLGTLPSADRRHDVTATAFTTRGWSHRGI
jgi:hypothetical protein